MVRRCYNFRYYQGVNLKKSAYSRERVELVRQRALLLTLSEDLALPLLQVKSSVELLQAKNFAKAASRQHAADSAISVEIGLQLVEAYKLLLNAEDNHQLPIEPLAIGVTLEQTAHKLGSYAKQYGTTIEISVQPRLAPILAHQASLSAAMEILAASLIRAQAAQVEGGNYRLILGAHRAPGNTVATGVFSSAHGLSDRTLRAARSLVGKARQPLPAVPAGSAAGVLIADMLCASLWQPLRAAAHHNLPGLVTMVPASKQLQII